MTSAAPASLRRQLLVHLSGPLMLVLVLGAAAGMFISRQVGYLVHDQWLLDSAMTLAAQVRRSGGGVALDLPPAAIQMFEWDRIDHIFWQAASARQGVLLNNAHLPAPPETMLRDKPQFYNAEVGGQPVRVVAVEYAAPPGVADTIRIQVAETMHKRDIVASKTFMQWVPLQVALLGLAGTFIWLAVTRNLRKIDAVAARLGRYETDSLMPILDPQRTPAEITPLISAINQLIVKLSDEQQSQKRFISNAAHQLRTPLAALEVQTQRALRERDPLKRDQALNDVHRAVTRLHHVTRQLLTLMRSEQQSQKHLRWAAVDLAGLARDEVERWTDSALRKGIDLGYEGPESELIVTGDAHLLREMFSNLIDNAVRYTQQGGTVTVALHAGPVTIYVDDDGPGIPMAERSLVLERFYRGSSSEQAGGCGLGLPIASEIAARHGAQLSIAAAQATAGTRIAISFPPG